MAMLIDGVLIRKDFPIFQNLPGLVYLDSTATSLKPQSVLEKMNDYYTRYGANIHRGIYKISEQASEEFEKVREKTAKFIGAKNPQEIIFCRNATEAINLVASSWGRHNLMKSDSVVTTIMEHHANFVTWQQAAKIANCEWRIANITPEGKLDEADLLGKIDQKTKLVTLAHVSNVLGTINPIKELVAKIKQKNPNCLILVDGAQAVPHMQVDVVDLACDFYVYSAHKMLGPTGVGVLWGRYHLLEKMQPYQYGGDMIQAVYPDHTDFKKPAAKFEAGTPDIAGVIGLGTAIDYLEKLGMDKVRAHEIELTEYAFKKLKLLKELRIYGPHSAQERCGVVTFTMEKAHPHDIAQVLDSDNICIRSGHHCAMPLHLRLGLSATARASFYIYNTKEDIDRLIEGLKKVQKMFG